MIDVRTGRGGALPEHIAEACRSHCWWQMPPLLTVWLCLQVFVEGWSAQHATCCDEDDKILRHRPTSCREKLALALILLQERLDTRSPPPTAFGPGLSGRPASTCPAQPGDKAL